MFGNKLQEMRKHKGWSLHQLAAESGLSPRSIMAWETSEQVPSWDAMLNLCLALDVECSAFPAFDATRWQGSDRGTITAGR